MKDVEQLLYRCAVGSDDFAADEPVIHGLARSPGELADANHGEVKRYCLAPESVAQGAVAVLHRVDGLD